MQSIKFIYFDVGSVLIDWQDVFKTAADSHHLSVDEIGLVFDENSEDITKGMMTPSQFWSEVVKKYAIAHASNYDF